MTLSVLNYGAGNLRSIENVLEFLNANYRIITSSKEIEESEIIILPGVGHFGQLIEHFAQNDLVEPLKKHILAGKPYLGICLGMQILFESSEEAHGKSGITIFKGQVLKFTQGKVPQIGWNNLQLTANNNFLREDYVYFVNSFYVTTPQEEIIAAKTNYYIDFVSAVQHNNLLAVQFHPEKSGTAGSSIVKRWLDHVN